MPESKIARNTTLNLAGQVFPMLVGFLCIPSLIKNIGLERFGILTVVWATIGYFSLFDFGLSRVVTAKVASLRQLGEDRLVPPVFWSSMRLIFLITVIGSMLLFVSSFFINFIDSKTSEAVLAEGIVCLRIMAITLPAITLTSGLKGFLEAQSYFGKLNFLQALQGLLNFSVPLLISYFNTNLVSTVIALAILRYLFFALHLKLIFKVDPQIKEIQFWSLKKSLPLLKEGGWISVTNIVGPIMIYFDRFFLTALFPASSLAYYTTPFEMVSKILVIPSALTRTLFPQFAKKETNTNVIYLYERALIFMVLTMTLIVAIGIPLSKPLLEIWINRDFAEISSPLLCVLLVGFAINAIAWIPFTLLQGLGRSDLAAKLHLCEVPLYLLALYYMTSTFGLKGTAIAWGLRSLFDLIGLLALTRRQLTKFSQQ